MRMLGFWAFCFALPWLLFFGYAFIVLHFWLVVFAVVALVVITLIVSKLQTDKMLDDAWALTRERQAEDRVRAAEALRQQQPHQGAKPPAPSPGPTFDRPFPAQYTSFAFRYGLPPVTLRRKAPPLPPPPRALPPPATED